MVDWFRVNYRPFPVSIFAFTLVHNASTSGVKQIIAEQVMAGVMPNKEFLVNSILVNSDWFVIFVKYFGKSSKSTMFCGTNFVVCAPYQF